MARRSRTRSASIARPRQPGFLPEHLGRPEVAHANPFRGGNVYRKRRHNNAPFFPRRARPRAGGKMGNFSFDCTFSTDISTPKGVLKLKCEAWLAATPAAKFLFRAQRSASGVLFCDRKLRLCGRAF